MAVLPAVLLLCAVGVGHLRASPVRTYDQRQQGELNIHAQLDNIVIVLVPTSNFDLFGLKGVNRFGQKPDKDEILQFLQKPHKNDIDRYEIIKDENDNDIKEVPVTSSQDVPIVQQGEKNTEKEEEVVATVEEMKPDATTKATTDPPKSEATEDSPIKEHSTVSESVQELVFKVSVPVQLKDKAEPPQDTKPTAPSKEPETDKSSQNQENTSEKEVESTEKVTKIEPTTEKEESSEKKDHSLKKEQETSPEPPAKKPTIEDFIKPVAAKEEKTQNPTTLKSLDEPVAVKKTSSLVEGARKEKVIRYKPETKWAPGLVDMLAAPRTKATAKEVEEKQRFAALCAPGSWDTELKTCIMPGETRR